MPDIDGLELCRRLRAPNRKVYTYIILLTSMTGKNRYLEGLEAGADDFLTKPVDKDELAARLKVGERIIGLQKEMRQMQGLLSICMLCKKIREARSGSRWTLTCRSGRPPRSPTPSARSAWRNRTRPERDRRFRLP
jgi:DNA-binding response OmpR family regulator